MTITTREQLIRAVEKIWEEDEEIQNICAKLVNSMTDRLNGVIKSQGYN